jgi:hypothetical protein
MLPYNLLMTISDFFRHFFLSLYLSLSLFFFLFVPFSSLLCFLFRLFFFPLERIPIKSKESFQGSGRCKSQAACAVRRNRSGYGLALWTTDEESKASLILLANTILFYSRTPFGEFWLGFFCFKHLHRLINVTFLQLYALITSVKKYRCCTRICRLGKMKFCQSIFLRVKPFLPVLRSVAK